MMERNLNNSSLFTFSNFQQMLAINNIGACAGIIIINVFLIMFTIQVEVHLRVILHQRSGLLVASEPPVAGWK